jgi:pimeloyl-ACP methyl ester carboxylesterase
VTLDLAPRTVALPTGRTVGFRKFGTGSPVALLHASPRSAAALLPLGLRLADRHTIFAFDSPGFGWSDPLAFDRPDAADYGDALIEAFDAIGIARAPVYGSHTGAAIAVEAARRHPSRVPALALDGYSVFTPTDQAEYLANYLAPIRPAWDGTHLAFLWSRVKDQFTVFPWYLNAQAARLPRPRVPLDVMQGVIVDFLAAGDAYRAGYAAAFRYDGLAGLRALSVPTTVMARSDDLLFGHLDAVQQMPACIAVRRLGEDHALWAEAIREALANGAPGEAAPAAGERGGAEVRVPVGVIGIRHSAGRAAGGRPIVLLPGIPGSARGEAALARALGVARPVYTADLPGFGASSLPGKSNAAVIARSIAAALRQRGVTDFDLVAIGESASIACLLRAAKSGGLVLLDPVADEARDAIAKHMADITPRPDGSHLLAAWHQLRDMGLWRPWFATDPAHAIPNGADPDVPRMHAILTDWMRGGTEGSGTLVAAMATPLSVVLPPAAAFVMLPDHPWSAGRGPNAVAVPDDRHARAAAILRLLDRAS